jgi:hypothetical protein
VTDEQIIEHCLASVAEYHPPCEVPEGIWGFTDRTLRSLLQEAIESKGEQMFDPHAVGSVVATLSMERDQAYAATDAWVQRCDVLQGRLKRAHAAIERLGVALADADHQWSHDQRREWERAERMTRDQE